MLLLASFSRKAYAVSFRTIPSDSSRHTAHAIRCDACAGTYPSSNPQRDGRRSSSWDQAICRVTAMMPFSGSGTPRSRGIAPSRSALAPRTSARLGAALDTHLLPHILGEVVEPVLLVASQGLRWPLPVGYVGEQLAGQIIRVDLRVEGGGDGGKDTGGHTAMEGFAHVHHVAGPLGPPRTQHIGPHARRGRRAILGL